VVLTGKLFSGAVAVLAAGAPLRSAVLSGVALAQVGEFAFILAQEGQRVGLLAPNAYNLFLSLSVISMIITPFLIQWSPKLARRTQALQRFNRWFPTWILTQPETPHLKIRDHVIIVGYGLNGRNLSRVLHEMEIPYIVLDISADLVQSASKAGVHIVYGDATNSTVMKQAGIEKARVLVIAASDPFGARRIVKQARGLNPNLHIMVRTRYLKELQELHDLGANEVIPEEFETSIEIFTLVLKTYKVPQPVILQKAEHIRREGYALLRRGELPELAHHLRGGTLADVEVETCRIEEDSPAVGKSLGEVGIHRRTGSSIVALTRNGVTQSNPPMSLVFDVGDVLVILGSREQIRKARALILDTKTID
jgi:CPA2 family monovalent cation:H+ antiporter-2